MRTLESAYALELAKRRTAALRRAVDTYTTASLFVSTREGRWALMHMNDSALRLAGMHALDPKTDFWDVFRCAGPGTLGPHLHMHHFFAAIAQAN